MYHFIAGKAENKYKFGLRVSKWVGDPDRKDSEKCFFMPFTSHLGYIFHGRLVINVNLLNESVGSKSKGKVRGTERSELLFLFHGSQKV